MYALLASAPYHQSARDHMQALFERMGAILYGNFIRDFQGERISLADVRAGLAAS